MSVFVDTSAVFAFLDADDRNHQAAKSAWSELARERETIIASNYVLVETVALVGRRLGLQAVRDLQTLIVPVLQVFWVDEPLHERAIAALLTASKRDLSLVDCVSFEIMRRLGLGRAFAFDSHFASQGFQCVP